MITQEECNAHLNDVTKYIQDLNEVSKIDMELIQEYKKKIESLKTRIEELGEKADAYNRMKIWCENNSANPDYMYAVEALMHEIIEVEMVRVCSVCGECLDCHESNDAVDCHGDEESDYDVSDACDELHDTAIFAKQCSRGHPKH